MNILITGANGYIANMLCELFAADEAVTAITAIDMQDSHKTEIIARDPHKISWITQNLADDGWQEQALAHGTPDVIIHCAFVIREQYGKRRQWQIRSNVTAAQNVFSFAFTHHIPKLIYFSTVASYGALPTNSPDHFFTEDDLFRKSRYSYAEDKRVIEENLHTLYDQVRKAGSFTPQIFIIRPASVTGPRGQGSFKKLGLLSMIKQSFPFIPLTDWRSARQYVHEDDIANAVLMLTRNAVPGKYEVFNLSPKGYLLLRDIAKMMNKKVIKIPVWFGKMGFWFAWHITRGKFPTPPESIDSFSYPINVDGSKITRFGFHYRYTCTEAFLAQKGRFAKNNHEQ